MGMTPEELIDRLARLDELERRLQAATDPTPEEPGDHQETPAPGDIPTLTSAIATHEQIVTRLERAIADTPASKLGSLDYGRMLTAYRQATETLSDLRSRLAEETQPTTTEARPGEFRIRTMLQLTIAGLIQATIDGVITREQYNQVWDYLVDNGVCEVAGLTPDKAMQAYMGMVKGQQDLEDEEDRRHAEEVRRAAEEGIAPPASMLPRRTMPGPDQSAELTALPAA